MEDVSQLIRTFRQDAGLSQAQLAERARMSVAAIGSIEQGSRRSPYRSTIAAIADALDLSASDRELLASAAERARGRSKAVAAPVASRSLPQRVTSFVERDDTATIASLLAGNRLLTVTGSAGVGKTRTAIEVALRSDERKDVLYVDLAPVSDPNLILDEIAAAFHASLRAGDDKLAVLTGSLKTRSCLIVIDNCEHLVAYVASMLSTILQLCPCVSVLATSRERIGLSNEIVYRLPSLSNDRALELFTVRTHLAQVNFDFSPADLAIAAEICQALGGIPLAIELAAARVPYFGLAVLRARLHDSLTASSRDVPARHQTMMSAIAWSHDLLMDQERRVFRRLGVFAGGFTLDAAAAVCSEEIAVPEAIPAIILSLTQKSLIEMQQTANGRYKLLESVRAFAKEQLDAAGEAISIARRHAMWLAEIGKRLRVDLSGMSGNFVELDNLRAAVQFGLASDVDDDRARAGEIIGNFRHIWLSTARFSEFIQLAETALRNLDADRHLIIVARIYGPLAGAVEMDRLPEIVGKAIPLFEACGEYASAAGLSAKLALNSWKRGLEEETETALLHAFANLDRAPRNDRVRILALVCRAWIRGERADYSGARSDMAELDRLTSGQPEESRFGMDAARATTMCEIECAEGNIAAAIAVCEGYIAAYETKTWDLEETCYMLAELSAFRLLNGEVDRADRVTRQYMKRVPVLRWDFARHSVLAAAAILVRRGEAIAATRLVGCVDAYIARNGYRYSNLEQRLHVLLMTSLREQISSNDIASYATRGSTLTLEEIRDEILEHFPAVTD